MALRAVAPPIARPKSWGFFRLSADQTTGLGANGPIQFNTVVAGNLGLSGYTITLPQGRIFKLSSALSVAFGAANSTLRTCWFNVTSGQWIGAEAQIIPGTNTTAWSSQPSSQAVVDTIGGAVAVQLRINAVVSASYVFAIASSAEAMEIA